MEEREIIDELQRISRIHPQRNVYRDCMKLQLLENKRFSGNGDIDEFDRITENYRMTDIIEFSRIGRAFKNMDPDKRIKTMIRINSCMNIDNFHFIVKNFA